MKKIFKLTLGLLVAVSIFALTSCGNNEKVNEENITTETSVAEQKELAKDEITFETIDISDVENGTTLQNINYINIKINNESIQKIFDEINEEYKNNATKFKDENGEEVRELRKDMPDAQYEYTMSADIVRNDDKFISICTNIYEYMMGAHGSTYISGINIDKKTGKRIYIEDIVKSKDELKTFMEDWLQKNVEDEMFLQTGNESISRYFDDLKELEFIIKDNDKVILITQQYEFGSYAEGSKEIELDSKLLK